MRFEEQVAKWERPRSTGSINWWIIKKVLVFCETGWTQAGSVSTKRDTKFTKISVHSSNLSLRLRMWRFYTFSGRVWDVATKIGELSNDHETAGDDIHDTWCLFTATRRRKKNSTEVWSICYLSVVWKKKTPPTLLPANSGSNHSITPGVSPYRRRGERWTAETRRSRESAGQGNGRRSAVPLYLGINLPCILSGACRPPVQTTIAPQQPGLQARSRQTDRQRSSPLRLYRSAFYELLWSFPHVGPEVSHRAEGRGSPIFNHSTFPSDVISYAEALPGVLLMSTAAVITLTNASISNSNFIRTTEWDFFFFFPSCFCSYQCHTYGPLEHIYTGRLHTKGIGITMKKRRMKFMYEFALNTKWIRAVLLYKVLWCRCIPCIYRYDHKSLHYMF